VLGVLFFGLCGLVVLLVPFLDRGPKTRGILNGLASLAVAFFVVMTAWGWFSGPDQRAFCIALGALLSGITLALVVPFAEPGSARRRVVYVLMALSLVVVSVAVAFPNAVQRCLDRLISLLM